jgi:hypothetical protein
VYGIFTMTSVMFVIQSMIPDIYSDTLDKYRWDFVALPIVTNYLYWAFFAPLIYRLLPWLTWQKDRGLNLLAVLLFGPEMEQIIRSIYTGSVGSFIELWAMTGAFLALDYYRRFQQHQMKLLSAEKDLADARLTSLRMQLNPHFLFNAFNSVISLVDTNRERAKDMLSELSSLMRHLLKQDKRHTITLYEKVEFNRRYLDIEAIRFQDRLMVSIDHRSILVNRKLLKRIVYMHANNQYKLVLMDDRELVSARSYKDRVIQFLDDNPVFSK